MHQTALFLRVNKKLTKPYYNQLYGNFVFIGINQCVI